VTQTGLVVGTPLYLAPEVVLGGQATELSDVYGLGALMYHCLSGRKLYFHTSQENLYPQILAGKYIPLGKAVRGVPRPLRAIVHQCLARKPEKRFQSAVAVRQALDLFMAGKGIWVNHAERLVGYLRAQEHLAEKTPTSVDVSVSDMVVRSAPAYRPPRRKLKILLLTLVSALAGAGTVLVALKLGWLAPIFEALGVDITPGN
jgi:serine/threonine protein kinase